MHCLLTHRSNFLTNTGLVMWLDLMVDCFKMLKSHCFAHKLALACQHSSDDVAWLQIFATTMLRLWVYSSKTSVRTAELEARTQTYWFEQRDNSESGIYPSFGSH
jgi:hypothetical protein